MMFEYGVGYLEQNDIALADMTKTMSPAAVALAELMAEEDFQLDDDESADEA